MLAFCEWFLLVIAFPFKARRISQPFECPHSCEKAKKPLTSRRFRFVFCRIRCGIFRFFWRDQHDGSAIRARWNFAWMCIDRCFEIDFCLDKCFDETSIHSLNKAMSLKFCLIKKMIFCLTFMLLDCLSILLSNAIDELKTRALLENFETILLPDASEKASKFRSCGSDWALFRQEFFEISPLFASILLRLKNRNRNEPRDSHPISKASVKSIRVIVWLLGSNHESRQWTCESQAKKCIDYLAMFKKRTCDWWFWKIWRMENADDCENPFENRRNETRGDALTAMIGGFRARRLFSNGE